MDQSKSLRHDGSHIENPSKFFEWWYFDFDLKDGRNVYIEWQSPVFSLRNNLCLLIIRIYENFNKNNHDQGQSTVRVLRYSRAKITQDKNFCKIIFPGGRIEENNGDYKIFVKEKDITVDVTLKRQLPFFCNNSECIYKNKTNNEWFNWIVPLPRAQAKGKIEIDRRTINIEGIAYHDHNWGNLNIAREFKGWVWTRVFFKDFTFIFSEIEIKGKKEKLRILCLLDKSGKQINAIDLKVSEKSGAENDITESGVPYSMKLSFNADKQYEISLISDCNYVSQEFPLGMTNNNRLNTLLVIMFYLLKLKSYPKWLKSHLGKGQYLQTVVNAQLSINGEIQDKECGKLERFVFGA
ncbi:MAG: lipocalin-like domain-containing protein [Candidatus Omnitrophota bacterium]